MKLKWWNNFHVIFSYFVLLLILISCAACLVIFLGMRKYKGSSIGCEYKSTLEGNGQYLRVVIIFTYTLVFQLLLLLLLLIPLLQHTRNTASFNTSQKIHFQIMKRLSMCAFVAICWNGIMGMIVIFCLKTSYSLYRQVVYDADFIVLLTCTIISFRDWRNILLPWKHSLRKTTTVWIHKCSFELFFSNSVMKKCSES